MKVRVTNIYLIGANMKKTLFPVFSRIPNFKLIRNRCEQSNFALMLNHKMMHESFRRIYSEIPRIAGYLVVFGEKNNKVFVLAVISSEFDLREAFFVTNNEDQSRYAWIIEQLLDNGYSELSFQMAKLK